jgi:hypothetical protein
MFYAVFTHYSFYMSKFLTAGWEGVGQMKNPLIFGPYMVSKRYPNISRQKHLQIDTLDVARAS